jgi:hypothetical protein
MHRSLHFFEKQAMYMRSSQKHILSGIYLFTKFPTLPPIFLIFIGSHTIEIAAVSMLEKGLFSADLTRLKVNYCAKGGQKKSSSCTKISMGGACVCPLFSSINTKIMKNIGIAMYVYVFLTSDPLTGIRTNDLLILKRRR